MVPDSQKHRALELAAKTRELRDSEHDTLWDEHEVRDRRSTVWREIGRTTWRLVGSASALVGLGLALREVWRAVHPS